MHLAEHRCREHDLIGAGVFGKGRQTVPQLMRAADEDPRAIGPARLFLMRRIAVGLRLFRARQRAIVTAHPAHVAEVDSGGEPLGLDFGAGADCRSGQDRMRPLQPGRGLEAAAIQSDRVGSLDTGEVMREGEAQPDAARELGAVGADPSSQIGGTGTSSGITRIARNGWPSGKLPVFQSISSLKRSRKSSSARTSCRRRSANEVIGSVPGARPMPRSIRPDRAPPTP